MKFTACVEAIFGRKMDFFDSLAYVKNCGCSAFEFYAWWKYDINRVVKVKDELDMKVVATCTKFISLVDKTAQQHYIEGLESSILTSKKLGCRMLISQVGNDLGIDRGLQRKHMVQTLKKSAHLLEDTGTMLAIEPLNTLVDHQGYYLSSSLQAFDIIEEIGSPNIKLLFDIYHQQVTEGNILSNIKNNINNICHFHAAGVPGRHELYNGELNYPNIFKEIEALGYNGYVGLEYSALDDPETGIKMALEL